MDIILKPISQEAVKPMSLMGSEKTEQKMQAFKASFMGKDIKIVL